jgi:Cof subfamily protein (haloacid dehalogenase superfamily)
LAGTGEFDRSKIKAAAFDLDGTILLDGAISPDTRRALRDLNDSGVNVILATGRHYRMILPYLKGLPFIRHAVCANGAQVVDLLNRRTICFSPMDGQAAEILTGRLVREARSTQILLKDEVLISVFDIVKMGCELSKRSSRKKRYEIFKWARFVLEPVSLVSKSGNTVIKINAYFSDPVARRDFQADIEGKYPLEIASTMGNDVEITARGVNKGSGLEALCAHLGIEPAQVIVFGDSGNDLAMIRWAGWAVAMGNADPAVAAEADWAAPPAAEDGAARMIRELFL